MKMKHIVLLTLVAIALSATSRAVFAQNPNFCENNDCSGVGVCSSDSCLCFGGFTGAYCENPPGQDSFAGDYPHDCSDLGLAPFPVEDCWELQCGDKVDLGGKHCGMKVKCAGEVEGFAVVSLEGDYILVGHSSTICAGVNEALPLKTEVICTEKSGGKPVKKAGRFEVEVNLTGCGPG